MKRTEKLTLNIGLNNNHKTVNEILQHIKYSSLFIENEFNFRNDVSEYKNEVEQTLILEGFSSFCLSTCVDTIERLSSVFKQDCIGAKIGNNELLIYRIGYDGIKQRFDNKYFLTMKKENTPLIFEDVEHQAFNLLEDSADALQWITEQPEFETLKEGSSAKEIIKEIEKYLKH